MTLRRRLTLTHIAFALAGIALGAIVATTDRPAWTLALVAGGTLSLGILGALISRHLTRHLEGAIEISRAWLRGNLSLRIADPTADDLGQLAEQLNQLAAHLERDEQDLAELHERNARLTDQVRALAVVEERNRLARELHDSVKQHLFSLAMTASAIRARFDALPDPPDDLAEMVREVETAAQTAQRETTRLIEDLRPGSLQEQGLVKALNDYTLLFGAQEHLLVYLNVQGDEAHLPPSVAEALYRVAQEALHNVTRHAHATRADVQLRFAPGQVALTVRDNGVGFDTTRPRRGLGLANMQERLLAVGGRLSVESRPGAGTTVLAQVALVHHPETGAAALDQQRPHPRIENWTWLGQRLVIPVGQIWPWLPADQAHLRRPLVEPGQEPLVVKKSGGVLGLRRNYVLRAAPGQAPLVRLHQVRGGYEWESTGATWALHRVSGPDGRAVLRRNEQPLAALQYRGRELDTWSEIVYDGRGYRLCYAKQQPRRCVLTDQAGRELLAIQTGPTLQMTLQRALPLPLLAIAAARVLDETSTPVEAVATDTQHVTRNT